MPGALIGQMVDVRADAKLVRISRRGQVVKVHPRMPAGRRSTDPEDLPSEKTAYAMRDVDRLLATAAGHGAAVGGFAAALLDVALPWTRMRSVYRLLGLVRTWGPDRVDDACRRALDAEAVDIGLIGRMLERATEADQPQDPPAGSTPAGRFARDPDEFTVDRPDRHTGPDRPQRDTGSQPANGEVERLRAAYAALCAHVRDVHGIDAVGTASQVEAQHQQAHAREATPWHADAWRPPAPARETTR